MCWDVKNHGCRSQLGAEQLVSRIAERLGRGTASWFESVTMEVLLGTDVLLRSYMQ